MRFVFEDISSERSMWTNSDWSWSPQTFSFRSLAVWERHCFREVIVKHSWAVLAGCGSGRNGFLTNLLKLSLYPFLTLFLSQLQSNFFLLNLSFFLVFKKYPGSFISLQTLLEVLIHYWKWWGLVMYQFCYWNRTHAVLNPAILSVTIFGCLRGKCSRKSI